MAIVTAPVLLGAVIVATIVFIIRRLQSPIASLPGSKLSLFTSLPLKYQEFRGNRTDYVHSQHLKYGPTVRVAPNEAVFTSLEAMKEIYMSGGSGYDKTEFYYLFKQYNTKTMFSTLGKQDHSKRKRILADRYANTNVSKDESLNGIKERSRNFVKKVAQMPDMKMDVYIFLHCYAFDSVTHHLFHPFGSNSINDVQHENIMREVSFDNSLVRKSLSFLQAYYRYLTSRPPLGLLQRQSEPVRRHARPLAPSALCPKG